MSVDLMERRKGTNVAHAVCDDAPFAALCGRELDGSYETAGGFYPTSNPAGSGYCRRCNDAAALLIYGEVLTVATL